MDINNNQQTNTFTKGMNTDVSDMLMDSSQYRYAENIRLVTNTDSNSGEIRVVDGTEYTGWSPFPGGTIKAMTSIRDVMIVAGFKNGLDNIYVYDTSDNKGWVQAYIGKQGEQFGEFLSLVTRYENEKLIKLYIADGENQLMYINLAPYIKFIGAAPDAVEGIDDIAMNLEEFIMPIKAEVSESSGSVPGVKVQYAYRYYKLGGAATQISPMSNPVTIYKTSNEGYAETDQTTSKSVELTLPSAPKEYIDRMQIYRISYIQVGQPPLVNLIYDNEIMSDTKYIDRGTNVQSVDVSEFLSIVKFTFIPKVIESKNNYLFAGNIKYIQSDIDSFINDDDVRCLSTGDYDGDTVRTYNKQFESDNIMEFDISNWKIKGTNKAGGVGEYFQWTYNIKKVVVDKYNRKFEVVGSYSPGNEIKTQLQSLRQGEVYRYGAIFYDKEGNKSSVKWIADIMAPNVNESGERLTPFWIRNHLEGEFESEAPYGYLIYQIGINFTVTKMPEGISAIEIVRVDRSVADRITISEGPSGFPYRIYHKDTYESGDFNKTSYICPTGFLSTNLFYADSSDATEEDDDQIRSNKAFSDNNYLMFSSPEYVYQSDDIKNLIKTNKNKLQIDVKYNMYSLSGGMIDGGTSYKKLSTGLDQQLKPYDLDNASLFNYSTQAPDFVQQKAGSDTVPSNTPTWKYDMGCAFYNSHEFYKYLIGESVLSYTKYTISAYVALAHYINIADRDKNKYSIDDVAYPTVPQFDTFFGEDEHKTNWANDIVSVNSDTQYSCWSAPLLMGVRDARNHMENESTLDYHWWDDGTVYPSGIVRRYPCLYPTGTTGKCMVMHLTKPMPLCQSNPEYLSCPIIRLRKIGVVPYGGVDTISNSVYISHGNIITQKNVVTPVFDGDCYPGVFVYNASHAWYEPNTPAGIRQVGIYIIPIESDIDLSATYGDTYNKLETQYAYYIQDDEAAINNNYQQNKKAYLYNTAYGAQPNAMTYSSIKYTEIDTSTCDTRVHYSQPKTNGEHIDNWLNFKALDFLDVDSRYGEITNMRLFKDAMLYWQNNATGILSINERTILNDASDNQIILGTSDVLQRYDHISTTYGMLPNQYEAETQSNNTQYFWDGNNREILAYAGGTELVPLTKIKAVSSYINTIDSINHPSLSYDRKFNELISSVVDDGAIVYNEHTQNFTSIYTFNPTYRATINDRLYYNDGNGIYRTAVDKKQESTLFGNAAKPRVLYVVNQNAQYPKVFDIATFGGRFYGGDDLSNIKFDFYTPLKQHGYADGSQITNREYDFRLAIPRNDDSSYGDRLRGKTMQCELSSDSNSTDFSLQYIITKYRMSWS